MRDTFNFEWFRSDRVRLDATLEAGGDPSSVVLTCFFQLVMVPVNSRLPTVVNSVYWSWRWPSCAIQLRINSCRLPTHPRRHIRETDVNWEWLNRFVSPPSPCPTCWKMKFDNVAKAGIHWNIDNRVAAARQVPFFIPSIFSYRIRFRFKIAHLIHPLGINANQFWSSHWS